MLYDFQKYLEQSSIWIINITVALMMKKADDGVKMENTEKLSENTFQTVYNFFLTQ